MRIKFPILIIFSIFSFGHNLLFGQGIDVDLEKLKEYKPPVGSLFFRFVSSRGIVFQKYKLSYSEKSKKEIILMLDNINFDQQMLNIPFIEALLTNLDETLLEYVDKKLQDITEKDSLAIRRIFYWMLIKIRIVILKEDFNFDKYFNIYKDTKNEKLRVVWIFLFSQIVYSGKTTEAKDYSFIEKFRDILKSEKSEDCKFLVLSTLARLGDKNAFTELLAIYNNKSMHFDLLDFETFNINFHLEKQYKIYFTESLFSRFYENEKKTSHLGGAVSMGDIPFEEYCIWSEITNIKK